VRRDRVGALAFRHPWVFSGALEEAPDRDLHGRLVRVVDPAAPDGGVLGIGTYSASSSIAVRVLAFGDAIIDRGWLATRIGEADARRRLLGLGPGGDTTGYRVVFGESDGLPGLVVDRYGDVVVFQISTAGMDRLRDDVLSALHDVFAPRAIVERSDLSVRREERLDEVVAVRAGDLAERTPFAEHGVQLLADPLRGQKTGFFLDQRDLRALVRRLSAQAPIVGGSVLNLFSYSGATGLMALLGGAATVHNVDGSDAALAYAREHAALHGLPEDRFTAERADVFQWLSARTEPAYDAVLVDPPALIKSQRDVEQGRRAYHFLNRASIRLIKNGGLLVTSSCSHYFSEDDLAFELRRAGAALGVRLDAVASVRQAADHPVSIYFPEAGYLKSLVLQVRR
jgi:23S rRNA (cytosine1962-C5)-methyltransferase